MPVGNGNHVASQGSYDERRPRRVDTRTNRPTALRLPGHRYRESKPLREPEPAAPRPYGPVYDPAPEPAILEYETPYLYTHERGGAPWIAVFAGPRRLVDEHNFDHLIEVYGQEWIEIWEARWETDGYWYEAQVPVLVRDTTTTFLLLAGPPEKVSDFFIPDSVSGRETEEIGNVIVRGQPREPGEVRRDLFP